mmetsp:Transcript_37407/g.107107  ORF Transcript_37407/g.107107 Transcript_37407/m.107107 type:complete len:211 (+) Transcript_37407:787-1419(+)
MATRRTRGGHPSLCCSSCSPRSREPSMTRCRWCISSPRPTPLCLRRSSYGCTPSTLRAPYMSGHCRWCGSREPSKLSVSSSATSSSSSFQIGLCVGCSPPPQQPSSSSSSSSPCHPCRRPALLLSPKTPHPSGASLRSAFRPHGSLHSARATEHTTTTRRSGGTGCGPSLCPAVRGRWRWRRRERKRRHTPTPVLALVQRERERLMWRWR